MRAFPSPVRSLIGWFLLCFLSGGVFTAAASESQMRPGQPVHASRGELSLPTYPWWPAVRHPYFMQTDGKNIYPYPMLDNLSRSKTDQIYQTVVLENEYLRITFLPALGGKIHEVIDKTTDQPMFYVNHVVKPGLIGMCGAWTSGGVEWNTGPQGHTVGAMQPMDVVILPPEKDGSRSVAIGETERIYGTKWTVVVTLRPGRSFIEERIRIYNATDHVRPYYFWNCTAVPNTPGFRFIYPMTLGTDHGAEKFFQWPIHEGKDLTRGTNYQDASSIFAWDCDQDFFGSYDDQADRGIVAFANHHQVPGKKAWTWGQGGFGKMHQMDLTDSDGPYNEVQTGPLLTQGEVGRLDPGEAVEWQEWWYPIHALGGFTFANRDLAANAAWQEGTLKLGLLGTATWPSVQVRVARFDGTVLRETQTKLSPSEKTVLTWPIDGSKEGLRVEVISGSKALAQFTIPLQLPDRKPPEAKPKVETASEFARAGWEHCLFARFDEAEGQFRKALERDPKSVTAQTGLAFLSLDPNPAGARRAAEAALMVDPDAGLAHLAFAAAAMRERDLSAQALEHAWKAALDPATAVPGRALAAKILLREGRYTDVAQALAEQGPWTADLRCQGYRAFASRMMRDDQSANDLARACLETDPLDTFALSVLWLGPSRDQESRLQEILAGNVPALLDLVAKLEEINQGEVALRILKKFYLDEVSPESRDPMPVYWARFLGWTPPTRTERSPSAQARRGLSVPNPFFPSGYGDVAILRDVLAKDPKDGRAALLLGHALFQLRRHSEGREMWKRAAELGAEPAIVYRALGMASLTLDKDPEVAAEYFRRAHEADPLDPIVARDFARVLFSQADKTDSPKKALLSQARDVLKAAFDAGRTRSDFVCLLARAQNRLEEHVETVRLLDSVRITVWEGSREAHDLFQEAHLAIGRARLAAGRAAEALREFNRALEYPENLAIGKLENAREGHIHKLRAEALTALGQTEAAREASEKAGPNPDAKP